MSDKPEPTPGELGYYEECLRLREQLAEMSTSLDLTKRMCSIEIVKSMKLTAQRDKLLAMVERAIDPSALLCGFGAQADDPALCCCGKPKAYHWKPDARRLVEECRNG